MLLDLDAEDVGHLLEPLKTHAAVRRRFIESAAQARVAKVFRMRFDPRAPQTLAWYVGWQLHHFLQGERVPRQESNLRTRFRKRRAGGSACVEAA